MATVDRSQVFPDQSPGFDEAGRPWLEVGARMDQETFLARYEKTPTSFKAELIDGVVYVASPVHNAHGLHDGRLIAWLFFYCAATPGTEVQANTTTILGPKDVPQPDSALFILPEHAGQIRFSDDGVKTTGPPDLVVEIAQSSRSVDLGRKLKTYERAGVREYLVVNLGARSVHWFLAVEGRFEPIEASTDGGFRSTIFPGLWLDSAALFANDKRRLIAALNRGLQSPEHAAFVAELDRRRRDLGAPAG